MTQELDTLIAAIETEIESITISTSSSARTAFVLLRNLDEIEHLGVYVHPEFTGETDFKSQAFGTTWERDRIRITLLYDVARGAAGDQRAARGEAIELEQLIRNHITNASSMRANRVYREECSRTLIDGRLEIVQTFRAWRTAVPTKAAP